MDRPDAASAPALVRRRHAGRATGAADGGVAAAFGPAAPAADRAAWRRIARDFAAAVALAAWRRRGTAREAGSRLAARRTRLAGPLAALGLAVAGLLVPLAPLGPVPAAAQQQGGGAVAARLQALEAEIRRLNGRIEELEFKLRRIAEDGGLRLSDLDFRVTEMEGGDLSLLGAPTPLGDTPGGGSGRTSSPPTPESDRVALSDARAMLDAGRPDDARRRLQRLLETSPDGPLTPEAEHWLGVTEMALGDPRAAAQIFLANVVAHPEAAIAPDSMLMLGRALADLGSTAEACDTFAEVRARHSTSPAASEALNAASALGCP